MNFNQLFTISLLSILLYSCTDKTEETEQIINPADYNQDWTTESHSKDVEPDYSIVFPQNKVLRMDINIPAENWFSMQQDLESNLGASTGGPGGGGPGGGPGGDPMATDGFDPIWVAANLEFENKTWNNIGIRFKGNSSLRNVYSSPINKFSFKLDFDEFEDDFPEIKNQRFFGFKQLNLNNNFGDASAMREKIAPELFREFGLVAPQTTFCEVYINTGDGSQYFGLYTLVEEVDNTVLASQYPDGSGNLYKPEGQGATFAFGSFSMDDMYLKTNEDEANYSDVESLYNILHNSERTSNIESWKSNLEAVFDVPVFLKWLAANSTIQNWDTYGRMNHNYYLYNNPETNKLEWIPWDNNEAFSDGKQGGAIAIDASDVNSNWPLINYILSDIEYETLYKEYLKQFISEVFTESKMTLVYDKYYDLIKESVINEAVNYSFTSASEFESELSFLKQHVSIRKTMVESYIN